MNAAFPIRWQYVTLDGRPHHRKAFIGATTADDRIVAVSQHQHTHTHTHGVKVSTPFRLLRAFNGLKWNVQITKCARIRREKEIKLSLYNLFKTNYVLAWRAELKHTKIAEEANNASAGESTSVWSWRLLRTHDPHNSVDWIALIEIVRSHSGANRKFHGHFTISSYRISDTVN